MKTPRTEAVVRMAVGQMREYTIIEHARSLERELIVSTRCQDILAGAIAEIKATNEGRSDQPIADIIAEATIKLIDIYQKNERN